MLAFEIGIKPPTIVNGARLVGDYRSDAVDQFGIPRGAQSNAGRKHCGRFRPPDAVQTLIPLVCTYGETIDNDGRTSVVEQLRFLPDIQTTNQVGNSRFHI